MEDFYVSVIQVRKGRTKLQAVNAKHATEMVQKRIAAEGPRSVTWEWASEDVVLQGAKAVRFS